MYRPLIAIALALSIPGGATAAASDGTGGIDSRVFESGPWSYRIDGDVIITRIERSESTSRTGNPVQGVNTTNELVLARPSLRYGTLGSGIWGAAKAEFGNRGRFLDHQENGPASGLGVAVGHDGMWIAWGNGYLEDPLNKAFAAVYLGATGPSFHDGSYASQRRTDPLHTAWLDAGFVWATMVAQIQTDDLTPFDPDPDAVDHSTVSAGIETDYGNFRFLTDTNGYAQEISWSEIFPRGQIEVVAAQVDGVVDRWGNTVSDRYFGVQAGVFLADNWTLGLRHRFNEADVRANNNWGDGSNQTIVMTTYEARPGHHVYGRLTYTDQFRTNAAAAFTENLQSRALEIGYVGQLDENNTFGIALGADENQSEAGSSTRRDTVRAFWGLKW